MRRFRLELLDTRALPASIAGDVFADLNSNGFRNQEEPALSESVVYLDLDNNAEFNANEPSATTDSMGHYEFPNLDPGTYHIRQIQRTGWAQTAPGELAFRQLHRQGGNEATGLSDARDIAVSPDGQHVYVSSSKDHALNVFARQADDGLAFVETYQDGQNGIDGLQGARGIAVSPDGLYVYVTGSIDDALSVFTRQEDGGLSVVESYRDGQGGIDGLAGASHVTISPEGQHIYVTGSLDNALSVFARQDNGTLLFLETYQDGQGNVTGLAGAGDVIVSPDGHFVYVTSSLGNALSVFTRLEDGRLSWIETLQDGQLGIDGLWGAGSVAVGPDGSQVYVIGSRDDALNVFIRQPDGTLSFVETHRDGQNGVDGLWQASDVTLSPDGHYVYVTASSDDAITVFARQENGLLSFLDTQKHSRGADTGLRRASGVASNLQSGQVYVTGALAGELTVYDAVAGGWQVSIEQDEHYALANFGNAQNQLTLTFQQTELREQGDESIAVVSRSAPTLAEPLVVTLFSNDAGEAVVPSRLAR